MITLEMREKYRRTHGVDPIPESVADEIRSKVAECWQVLEEDYTAFRLTFRVNPRPDVAYRVRYDMETELMKRFGNAPFSYYTDCSAYRLTFVAN